MVVKYNPNRVQETAQPLSLEPAAGTPSNFGGIQAQNELQEANDVKSFANALGQTSENLEELVKIRKKQKEKQQQLTYEGKALDLIHNFQYQAELKFNDKTIPKKNMPGVVESVWQSNLKTYSKGLSPEGILYLRKRAESVRSLKMEKSFRTQLLYQSETKKANTEAGIQEVQDSILSAPGNSNNTAIQLKRLEPLIRDANPNVTDNVIKRMVKDTKGKILTNIIYNDLSENNYGAAQTALDYYTKKSNSGFLSSDKTIRAGLQAKIDDIKLVKGSQDKASFIKEHSGSQEDALREANNIKDYAVKEHVINNINNLYKEDNMVANASYETGRNLEISKIREAHKNGKVYSISPFYLDSAGNKQMYSQDQLMKLEKIKTALATQNDNYYKTEAGKKEYISKTSDLRHRLSLMDTIPLRETLNDPTVISQLSSSDYNKYEKIAYDSIAIGNRKALLSYLGTQTKTWSQDKKAGYLGLMEDYITGLKLPPAEAYSSKNMEAADKYASRTVISQSNDEIKAFEVGKDDFVIGELSEESLLKSKGYRKIEPISVRFPGNANAYRAIDRNGNKVTIGFKNGQMYRE